MSWPLVPLGDIATLQRGNDLPMEQRTEGEYKVVGANGVLGYHAAFVAKGPGVTVGRSGSVGKVTWVDNNFWPLNTTLWVKDFHGNDQRFVYYLLYFMNLARYSEGASVPTLNRNLLHPLLVSLPPLVDQQRIAAILDKADALRHKRRDALSHLDRLLQSVFVEMFGDPVTNPKGWPVDSLKLLGKVVTGGTPPSQTPEMFGGNIPFITPGDLETAVREAKRTVTEAGAQKSRTVRAGSLLVCCIGATIGKMGIASQMSAFNQQINAVEWHGTVNDLFGLHVVRFFKKQIAVQGASTTLPILKKSLFETLEIPVPPLATQQKFAVVVEQVESLRACQRAAQTEADALFAVLQARAFAGEL